MLIDAHIHIWDRDMLPDESVRNYLEPARKFTEMYGDIFDFYLDAEIPFSDYDSKKEGLDEMITYSGMDKVVVLATDFGLINEGRMSNEEYMKWLYDQCQCDDRLLLFVGVDPNRKNAVEMLERFYDLYEPAGLKMYPATGFYPDDPRYEPFWKKVEELGLPVTTHAGMALAPLDEKYCHPSFMRAVAERHPDTKFIIAHLGGKFHDELFPLMEACDNVYTDCSALQGWTINSADIIRSRLIEAVSRFPDRVVYGSDFPLYEYSISASRFVDLIRNTDLGGERNTDALLGGNMARILGI